MSLLLDGTYCIKSASMLLYALLAEHVNCQGQIVALFLLLGEDSSQIRVMLVAWY